ncbi:MAG: hypothetical protein LBI03_11250, partial [Clostridiales bacterium]|nr:hypothetical protein [Clostridiales bacterium]
MQDFNNEGLTVSDNGAGIYPRTPYDERYVGLAYTTWCYKGFWNTNKVWTTPLLGKYTSDDRTVIRQHAEWIADAGVDFIWIDWSNDVDYDVSIKKVINDTARPDFSMIERSTLYIFEEYSKMRQEGKVTPKISIFIGCPDPSQTSAISDGRLTRKANQVYDWFVNNPDHPEYRDLIMDYNGKPLLVVYAGTPTPWGDGLPAWDDDRFTVRWMSGFLTQQPYLLNTDTLESKYGYWSWEDRGAQTFSVSDGKPEAMIVVPSWRAEETDPPGTGERYDGLTFKEQWARARLIGV